MEAHTVDVKPGCHLYGRYGAYIGVVLDAGPATLRVRAGTPRAQVYYVPTDAVIGALPGGREVFIRYRRDELERMGWQHPPK